MSRVNSIASFFIIALLVSSAPHSVAQDETVSDICKSAITLYRQGEFEKSVGILKQAVEQEKSKPQPDKKSLLSLYRNLDVVLSAWSHNDEAKEYKHLAEDLEIATGSAPQKVIPTTPETGIKKLYANKSEKLSGGIFSATFGFAALQKMDLDKKVPERLEIYDRAAAMLKTQTDNCIAETTRGLDKYPNDKYLLLMRATCLVRKHKGKEALADFNKIDIPPGGIILAPYLCSLGEAFELVKDNDNAVKSFAKALSFQSPNLVPALLINRAAVLCQSGKTTEALSDLTKFFSMSSSGAGASGAAYYWRAVAEKKLGNDAQATIDFHQAKELNYTANEIAFADDSSLISAYFVNEVAPPVGMIKTTSAQAGKPAGYKPSNETIKLLADLKAAYPNVAVVSAGDIEKFREKYRSTLSANQMTVLDQIKGSIERKYANIAEDYGADIDALVTIAPNDTQVLASFVTGAKAELGQVPPNLRQTFRTEGYKIILTSNIANVRDVRLLNEHPRGYPEGATYTSVPAYCDYNAKRIVIVEAVLGRIQSPSASLGHEMGHAMDYIYGRKVSQTAEENAKLDPRVSNTSLFIDAYNFDIANVPEKLKAEISYYMQPDAAGRRELFAELFPLLYGKQPDPNTYSGRRLILMSKTFPSALQAMRSVINIYD